MRKTLTLLAVIAMTLPAAAQEWNPIDSQSRGMGGAGVAVAEGAQASYWNPANLSLNSEEPFEFASAGFGFSAYGSLDIALEGDIISTLDRVNDLYNELDFQAIQDRLNSGGTATNADLQNAILILDTINDLQEEGLGALVTAGGGLDLRFGSFGVFYRETVFAALDPIVDLSAAGALSEDTLPSLFSQFTGGGTLTPAATTLSATIVANTTLTAATDNDGDGIPDADELAFHAQAALGDIGISDPSLVNSYITVINNTLANVGGSATDTLYSNQSGFEVRGIRLRETGVSVGVPVNLLAFPAIPSLNVGISAKEIIGETFREVFVLQNLEEGEEEFDEMLHSISENTTRTNRFNVDVGVSTRLLGMVTVGVVGRNLIPMEFEVEGLPDDFEMDPQVRAGVSFQPISWVRFAVDMDLLENEFDALEGFKSRLLSGGLEFIMPVVRIRGGAFQNISSDESHPVYAGGIGLSFAGVNIDVNGQLSSKKVEVEAESAGGTDEVEVPERLSVTATVGFDMRF